MIRLLHNFFQMYRKDNGAHFTYNIGVGFVRAGTTALLMALVLFVKYKSGEMYFDWWISVLVLSLVLLGVGLGQERLAMKYPRTDVDLDKKDLVVVSEKQMDELMKEFDIAYQKVMHNRDPVPPPTDRAKPDEKQLRLKTKDDPRQ